MTTDSGIGRADQLALDHMQAQLREHVATSTRANELVPIALEVAELMINCFSGGGSAWTFGNGGSAADAQHFSGELLGHYRLDRRPLPCLTLGTDWSVASCTANDYSFVDVFSRQVAAMARPGDVVCAFTTSGRSPNVVKALQQARTNRAHTVLFGGGDGGPALALADHALIVPSRETPRIQEVHTLLLHMISNHLDIWAAGGDQ
ncbi:D-sedoheptulose-7-phosphate isomerase [Propionibacteriaceae bacterium Y2011]